MFDGVGISFEVGLLKEDEVYISKKGEVCAKVRILAPGSILSEAMIFDPVISIFDASPVSPNQLG